MNKIIPSQDVTQATQDKLDIAENIILIMQQTPNISQKMMAKKLNMNYNTLKYYICKLREDGKVQHTGTSQKGKWIVNDKQSQNI